MRISFEYPIYLVILAIILAASLAFLLYYKDKLFKDLEPWKKHLMTFLRFFYLSILLLLLLNPIYKHISKYIQEPIVLIVQDNSKSIILNKDSIYYKSEYKSKIESLVNQLQNNYDTRYFQFGENLTTDSILDFSDNLTNISSCLNELISRFSGMNLAAVILATDGIYNTGLNPEYMTNLNFPIYSIALGDTITQKDLIIKDVFHNKFAFYKNKFPIRIEIAAEKCSEHETELNILRDNKIIHSSKIEIPANSTSKYIELDIEADKIGISKYDINLKALKNEISNENNNYSFVVNVIDSRSKILILANGPHPDIGAIKYAIQDNPHFDLSIKYAYEQNIKVSDYDLIILHQLPSTTQNISNILSEIEKKHISTLYIIGNTSSIQNFNNIQNGIEIISETNKSDEANPSLNPNFNTFDLNIDPQFFNTLSPLKVVFGKYNFSVENKVLLYQKINGIKTDRILMSFITNNNSKSCIIFGEGIWKWRLDDFKYNSEHSNFNNLINKTCQYLLTQNIKNKLVIDNKQIYNENEPIIIAAQVYNEAYQAVPNLDINFSIKDQDGKDYQYIFNSLSNEYRLDLSKLSSGLYKYIATTTFDNKEYSSTGEFIIHKLNLEAINTTANHALLFRLANKTSGQVFFPQNISDIPDVLNKNTDIHDIAYEIEKNNTISDMYFIFFIILIAASTEWILRKYWGAY